VNEVAAPLDVEALYRRYGPMVLRRCRKLLKDESRALDAMQDVFVKLMLKKDALSVAAPSAFLYRMATNECLNRIRTAGRRPETPDDELLARIAAHEDLDARSIARSFLGRLFRRESASTGAIAVMHLLDGMTLEEVASEVGMSVSGVRKRLRGLRARGVALEGVGRDEAA
jgi:RNA polymerase sigma-70 factor (ECF subfamily)